MKKITCLLLIVLIAKLASAATIKELKLASIKVRAEIADTDELREHGLMGRKKLDENSGMLFVFEREQDLGFWMKNTLIPLSIGYFDKNQKLVTVLEMEPQSGVTDYELKVYKSTRPAQFALEMSKGWFSKNKIKAGTSFSFIKK